MVFKTSKLGGWGCRLLQWVVGIFVLQPLLHPRMMPGQATCLVCLMLGMQLCLVCATHVTSVCTAKRDGITHLTHCENSLKPWFDHKVW